MTELQEFTASILERKENELALDFLSIKEKEEARLETAIASVASQENAEKERIHDKIALERSTALQRIENEKRNALLSARQEQLLGVFDKAYEQMASWEHATFSSFLTGVLAKLDATKHYQLILGERSQYALDLPGHVELSEKTIPNEAGFVIETEGVSYNYLFKALLEDMAPNLLGRLSKQLES